MLGQLYSTHGSKRSILHTVYTHRTQLAMVGIWNHSYYIDAGSTVWYAWIKTKYTAHSVHTERSWQWWAFKTIHNIQMLGILYSMHVSKPSTILHTVYTQDAVGNGEHLKPKSMLTIQILGILYSMYSTHTAHSWHWWTFKTMLTIQILGILYNM